MNIEQVLAIEGEGIPIVGSTFSSNTGADFSAARRYLEQRLEADDEPVETAELIGASGATRAHLVKYFLNCGLEFILPIAVGGNRIVSADEVGLNLVGDYFEGDIHRPTVGLVGNITGASSESRSNLNRLLGLNPDWKPLSTRAINERLPDFKFGQYSVSELKDGSFLAAKRVEKDDYEIIHNYSVKFSHRDSSLCLVEFGISYSVRFNENVVASASIGYTNDKEGIGISARISRYQGILDRFKMNFGTKGKVSEV